MNTKLSIHTLETGSDYISVSEKFIKEYKIDAKGLNIREASVHPRATENMNEIIDMIKTLIDKGYAYAVDNGDVYFRPAKFNEYVSFHISLWKIWRQVQE